MYDSRVVRVVAPSRLHFGMFGFGAGQPRQFGGVGVMIDQPRLELRIEPAPRLDVEGPLAGRVEQFAARWGEACGAKSVERRIVVVAAPPQHVGLGTGTQLALALGAGLNASFGRRAMSPEELTACMGRGRRSAVGTYGFFSGGLILEEGKTPGDALAPLWERIALPPDWRFVLLRRRGDEGLSGSEENAAFDHLPPVPLSVTRRLWEIARDQMAPAAREGRFAAFSESLYAFGHEAGLCFAAKQGGPYAGRRLEHWVAEIRRMGVAGVGQSSWGPTIFALLPDQLAAESFAAEFAARRPGEPLTWHIAAANNDGANIIVE